MIVKCFSAVGRDLWNTRRTVRAFNSY